MGFSWGWLCGRRNGPSGFGGASTADEVTAGVDASRLTVVVTGLLGLSPFHVFDNVLDFLFPFILSASVYIGLRDFVQQFIG
jgi:hypothetical protein